jgi:hypothetical protein
MTTRLRCEPGGLHCRTDDQTTGLNRDDFQLLADIRGEDDEDTALLRGMAEKRGNSSAAMTGVRRSGICIWRPAWARSWRCSGGLCPANSRFRGRLVVAGGR